ncbi:MAG: hypothetical protein MZV70_60320 [Desulfobacterales bacterium]|nr:hypothetical protein [Desulfobacterales bacterium]
MLGAGPVLVFGYFIGHRPVSIVVLTAHRPGNGAADPGHPGRPAPRPGLRPFLRPLGLLFLARPRVPGRPARAPLRGHRRQVRRHPGQRVPDGPAHRRPDLHRLRRHGRPASFLLARWPSSSSCCCRSSPWPSSGCWSWP